MNRNRNTYITKGIVGGLLLLLGLVFAIGFYQGFLNFNESSIWIFIAIAGGLVVLALSGILLIPRTRINRRPSSTYGLRESENYETFEKPVIRQVGSDFKPSKKLINSITGKAEFCDYCGIMLEKDIIFCMNCGNKIE
ncbi:MAG: hypothetical protein HGN29_13585 [Asgard group archaeon]|nr:hypothetical protein [Asgard group archaeon]